MPLLYQNNDLKKKVQRAADLILTAICEATSKKKVYRLTDPILFAICSGRRIGNPLRSQKKRKKLNAVSH